MTAYPLSKNPNLDICAHHLKLLLKGELIPNPDGVLPPESEQNTPEDKKIGFKPWDADRDRYWMGQQWSETYRKKED